MKYIDNVSWKLYQKFRKKIFPNFLLIFGI